MRYLVNMANALFHANRLFAAGLAPGQVVAQGYRDGYTKGEMFRALGRRVADGLGAYLNSGAVSPQIVEPGK